MACLYVLYRHTRGDQEPLHEMALDIKVKSSSEHRMTTTCIKNVSGIDTEQGFYVSDAAQALKPLK